MADFGLWQMPEELAEVAGHVCTLCGAGLPRRGKFCNRCIRRRVVKRLAGIAVAIELGVGLAVALWHHRRPHVVAYVPERERPAERPEGAANPGGWFLYKTRDSLLGDVTAHARLMSRPKLAPAGRPLENALTGVLEISSSTSYGQQILVTLDSKVRTACHANPCSVHAVFDGAGAEPFPFQEWSNPERTTLALGDFDRFTARLARAQDMLLVARLGMKQDYLVSFRVSGFRLAGARPARRFAAYGAEMPRLPARSAMN